MNGKPALNNFASNHGKYEIALLERNNLAKFSFKPLKRKKTFHVSKHFRRMTLSQIIIIHKTHFIKDISTHYNTNAAIRAGEQTEPNISQQEANLGRQLKHSNLQPSWVSGYISPFEKLCCHLCTISPGVTKQAASPRNQGEERKAVCTLRVCLLSVEISPSKGKQVIFTCRTDTFLDPVLIRSVQTELRSCLRQGIMDR